jgi:5'-nucleotidase
MKTILVDQDQVLGDWEGRYSALLAREYPHIPVVAFADRRGFYLEQQYADEHQEALAEIMLHPELYSTLEPIEGAIQAMHEMRAEGFDIAICTSPYIAHGSCASDKIEWVVRHLGLEWARSMVLTQDKTRVRGDILIDDKANIVGSQTPVWEHVIFDMPYNREVQDERIRLHGWANWRETILPLLER